MDVKNLLVSIQEIDFIPFNGTSLGTRINL